MIFKELEQPPALLRGRVAYEAFCEFRARLDPDWEPKPWEELTNELRADWAAVELSLTGAPE
jgi:hypothetical protein